MIQGSGAKFKLICKPKVRGIARYEKNVKITGINKAHLLREKKIAMFARFLTRVA